MRLDGTQPTDEDRYRAWLWYARMRLLEVLQNRVAGAR
jgi:hypothetical protein